MQNNNCPSHTDNKSPAHMISDGVSIAICIWISLCSARLVARIN